MALLPATALVDEALVVPEVEVGLAAVVGDEHLAVLERVHRARIDVDVRVELLHRDPQATGLEQAPQRRAGDALAEELAAPPVTKMCFVTGSQHTSQGVPAVDRRLSIFGLTSAGRQCEIDGWTSTTSSRGGDRGPLDGVGAAAIKDQIEALGDELLDHFVEARDQGCSWTQSATLGVTAGRPAAPRGARPVGGGLTEDVKRFTKRPRRGHRRPGAARTAARWVGTEHPAWPGRQASSCESPRPV